MKRQKILVLILIMSFLINTNASFCANTQNKNTDKQASKVFKGSVEDYRYEYINQDWWDNFNDPILKGYILKAVNDNYDLKNATLKVLEAKASVEESLGREFPSIDIGSSFSRNKSSGNIAMGSFAFPAYTRNTYSFPLSVNYELDFWLKNREAT